MFEMLMLLGFFVIGFSHLLPPSGPGPERKGPTANSMRATERRHTRGQGPAAARRAKGISAFRRQDRSPPGTLGKIRRLC